MTRILSLIVLALALPFTGFAANSAKEELKLIHVADLEKMMSTQKASTFVFDANTDSTRTKSGMIPGAKALTSSSSYPVSVLPSDKNATLVFYCANTQCMASHDAAKRAIAEGYKNSIVMADGIQGWVKAGKPIEKFAAK